MKNKLITVLNEAFTLTEVLITLLIIGVVASLTIPAIVNETQQTELRTAWKKNYALLDQASKMLMVENGGTLIGLFTSEDDMKNKFQNYLNYNTSCNRAVGFGNCWHPLYGVTKNIDGTISGNVWGWGSPTVGLAGLILNNGSLLTFGWGSTECTNNYYYVEVCGQIFVDVNGFKSPNKLGTDIFSIFVTKNGIKPTGTDDDRFFQTGGVWGNNFVMSRYVLYQ